MPTLGSEADKVELLVIYFASKTLLKVSGIELKLRSGMFFRFLGGPVINA
jgi:hypothetical protein